MKDVQTSLNFSMKLLKFISQSLDLDLDGNLFDRQDAFYYPYAGFHDARRGGPNYVVYARKPEVPAP